MASGFASAGIRKSASAAVCASVPLLWSSTAKNQIPTLEKTNPAGAAVSTRSADMSTSGKVYSPADEPMVPFKDAERRREMGGPHAEIRGHVLVVRIAYPGECAEDADGNGEVGDNAHDENGVVVHLMMTENIYEAVNTSPGRFKRYTYLRP